jgi:hypothetical protein
MEMPLAQLRIDLRRPDRFVPQEHLDCADVARPHHQAAGKCVPPGVEIGVSDAEFDELALETLPRILIDT